MSRLPRAEQAEGATTGRGSPLGSAATPRARVRSWPAATRGQIGRVGGVGGAARTAAAERASLESGVRFRRIFLGLLGFIVAVSAVIVMLGTIGMVAETRSRPLTAAEQTRYKQEEIARRWQAWPAAAVFPDEVKYLGLDRAQQYARRVGIAPESTCLGAVDAPVAAVLDDHGCVTVLRASYLDQTATFVITVGVAVLRDEESRLAAAEQLSVDDRVGVLPVAFPGTVTERFGQDQRQRSSWVGAGPYIVFSTAGYADGRTRAAVAPEEILHGELPAVAKSVGGQIAYFLVDPPKVPQCTQGNVC